MTDAEIIYLLLAEALCRRIEREFEADAYIVGGAVRSIMTGRPIKDIDITTSIDVTQLRTDNDLRVIDIGGGLFGSYKVIYNDRVFDFSRLRGEEVWEDGKMVEAIEVADIETDAMRRDFGINTGYLRVSSNNQIVVKDPINLFWKDITEKKIRFVGDGYTRIGEDPLRMMRAFRLKAQTGWELERTTFAAIRENADGIKCVAQERVREELNAILMSNNVKKGFYGLYESSLLSHILPEMYYAMSVGQNRHHSETVGEHLLLTVSAIRKPNLLLRWAALLHDIAKPKVRRWSDKKGDWTFYKHETQSAFDAKAIMRRFKFSNKEIDYVFRIVVNHMYYITDKTKLSTIRQFMHRAGYDVVRDILRLRIADRAGNLAKTHSVTKYLKMLLKMIRRVEKEDRVEKIRDLRINGHDLKRLGLDGKEIGDMLKYLMTRCIKNPRLNSKKLLTKLCRDKRSR